MHAWFKEDIKKHTDIIGDLHNFAIFFNLAYSDVYIRSNPHFKSLNG